MSTANNKAPRFTRQQIEWLDKMYPEHIGNPDTTEAEYRYRSGTRAVVSRIRDQVAYDPQEQ